jgi:hypothetical protein
MQAGLMSADTSAAGPSLWMFAALGALFGALGSATAYIIFYREYSHHFVDSRKASTMALRGALTAFAFIVGISVLAGYVITRFILPS